MITKKEIEGMSDGQRINFMAVFQNIEERLTRNQSSSFLTGNLHCVGAVPFKVWSNSQCFVDLKCNADAYLGVVCEITGKVNIYEGQISIIIDSCRLPKGDSVPDAMDFYDSKYDGERYWGMLYGMIQKNCSEKAIKVFDMVMEEYKKPFMTEFAAISHHDNCKSGLLGHSTKLVKLESVLNMYPEIIKRSGGKDVLYIGGALHDIGKVLEYYNGSISNIGRRVSHMVAGAMILADYEKEIIDLMGEEFYLNIVAIVSEHAGEYGERPRTVGAYVIHLLDMLESRLASLEEIAGNPQQLFYEGYKLN